MLTKSKGKMKIAGTYRVDQPMENFEIRVKIVQQKSLLAELFENEGETRDSNYLELEERTFRWQEKVFSDFEVDYYGEEKNCVNDKQKEYCSRIKQDDVKGSRLFSYVNDDTYYPDKSLLTKDYKSHLAVRNELALPVLRNRKTFRERYNKKVVDFMPTNDKIRSSHYCYTDREVMYILANLRPQDDTSSRSADSETLLCTVSYDRVHKNVTIDPDFTSGECYTVDGRGMSYDYWLEHASRRQSPEELKDEIEELCDEIKQRLMYKEVDLFHEVEMPPSNVLRVYINLDIVSAHEFAYDSVFVSYLMDLPKNWDTRNVQCLSGRTQRCRMKNKTAHFGHTAEISLDWKLDAGDGPFWPRLLFSVASLDGWTRYRNEGYGSLALPATPGSHSFIIRTWRPDGGFVDSLRRFFTGGSCELEDITYSCIPSTHQGTTLEKTHLKTIPSGSIRVNLNIAHQSEAYSKIRDLHQDTFKRLSAHALVNNVESVLEQFKAARDRMLQARSMHS